MAIPQLLHLLLLLKNDFDKQHVLHDSTDLVINWVVGPMLLPLRMEGDVFHQLTSISLVEI